jgi:hypothetical protein
LTWVSPERRTELNRGPFTEMMIKADAADIQVPVHAIGDGEDPLYDRRRADRLPALSITTKISTKLSLNRIKVIDSAASLGYMCACLDSKDCGCVFT